MLHYLASPYSHPDPAVMEERRVAACRKAWELIASGLAVISPIARNVAMIGVAGCAAGWERWREQGSAVLAACGKVLVLRLPGYEQSVGVAAEIAIAESLVIPVEYIEP